METVRVYFNQTLALVDSIAPGYGSWIIAGVVGLVVLIYFIQRGRSNRESLFGLGHGTKDIKKHTLEADKYVKLFGKDVAEEQRLEQYEQVVNSYYDLATDFYEYGWGSSFHFAQRSSLETLPQSLARHEHFLALKLQLSSRHSVADIGCGIGGPAREISRFSGCRVTGLNNNAYQVSRAERLTRQQALDAGKRVQFVKGDFMHQPFEDGQFDAAYAIEATCHAPDRVGCYREILRTVKPGGLFACYEWATTRNFDADNEEHRRLLDDIQVGNGLPGVISTQQVLDAAYEAGWDIVESADLAEPVPHYPVPWYEPFTGGWSIRNFRTSTLGIWFTTAFVWIFETLRILPAGTYNTQRFLIRGAMGLKRGGETQTFTPMFFFLARKPLEQSARSRSRSPRRRAARK